MAEEWKAHINYEKSKMIIHTGDTGSDKEANVCVETACPPPLKEKHNHLKGT